jgi:hypothetical protein
MYGHRVQQLYNLVGVELEIEPLVGLYGGKTGMTHCTFSLEKTQTIALCLWNLWKHRHAAAFHAQQPCLTLLLQMCREVARFWRSCLPNNQNLAVATWL